MTRASRTETKNSQTRKTLGGGGADYKKNSVKTLIINRGLSYALTAMLVVGLFFSFGWNAPETSYATSSAATIDISDTNPPESGEGWIYDSSTLTYIIKDEANVTITGSTNSENYKAIKMESGATATVTLLNAAIDLSEPSENPLENAPVCAFDMSDATINLYISGTNTLMSNYYIDEETPGLQVSENSTLIIDNATNANGILTVHGGGAGIGSCSGQPTGNITINGGTVNATGYNGAGIGSGENGTGGNITINGGTITATGGDGSDGIGNGSSGSGASGKISGDAVIITNTEITALTKEQGIILVGNTSDGYTGTVYGDVELPGDLTLRANTTLTVPADASLTVPADITLTVPSGATLTNEGTITNAGEIANEGTIDGDGFIFGAGEVSGSGGFSVLTGLTVSLTPDNGKVTLAPQTEDTGFAFYYTSSAETEANPTYGDEISGITGADTYSAETDISGANGTELFVQVYKVETSGSTIVGYGEASATPADTEEPTVTTVTPSGANAALSGNVAITFNEAMDTAAGTVKLNNESALTGGAWSNGNTVYTIPYSGLAYSTEYTVKISGFKDVAENEMAAVTSGYTFTTVADTTAPTVSSVTPTGTGKALAGNVVITFNEAMGTAAGIVKLNNESALTGGAWSEGNTVYTIPYSGLDYGTEYTVKISGFKDVAKNEMVAVTSGYTFTTVYTLTFNNNGGDTDANPTQKNVTYTEAVGQLPAGNNAPTKTGYTFAGWATAQDAAESDFNENTVWNTEGNGEVYAVWVATEYAITYALDGGTNGASNPENYTVENRESASFAAPAKPGYNFTGWTADYANAGITDITTPTTSYAIAGNATGDITLTAHWNLAEAKVASVTINPVSGKFAYKAVGENTLQLRATVQPANATNKTVTWKSSNPKIATVNASGLVTFVGAEGGVIITATAADGSGKLAQVTINSAKNVTGIRTPLATVYVKKGTKNFVLPVVLDDSTNKKVAVTSKLTWKSSNTKAVTVKNGKITVSKKLKKKTTVKITVSAANGKSKVIKVIVVPKATKLKKVTAKMPKKNRLKVGKFYQLKPTLNKKTATNVKVTFKSSNPKILKVDKAGKLVALKKGKAKITITAGGKKFTKTITVKK